jgi:prephenate dehydrogenase
MKKQDAPGTTFRKHNEIAMGLLSEDDFLLSEILLNPYSLEQLEKISTSLGELTEMVRSRNTTQLREFFLMLRQNLGVNE